MKRARLAYWVLLGVPTLALLVANLIEQSGVCTLALYGFTCPSLLAPLLPLALLGLFTVTPFVVIGVISIALAGITRRKSRDN